MSVTGELLSRIAEVRKPIAIISKSYNIRERINLLCHVSEVPSHKLIVLTKVKDAFFIILKL